MPSSVTTIQHEAFYQCSRLARVTLNEGLRELGDVLTAEKGELCGAFEDSALEEIVIPSTMQRLHYRTFRGCKRLAEIRLPTGLEKIGRMCFQGSGLGRITIPWTVTEIGERAFEDCAALKSVCIEYGSVLETIGEAAFANCKNIKTVYAPENVQISVPETAEVVRLPGANVLVASRCLGDYREMLDVVLPNGIRAVKNAWFANSGVRSVEIPPTVTAIEEYAFANCG